MTRQTVRNAYGGVRPTQEQKEKMLKKILESRDSPGAERNVYRAAPSRAGRFSTVAAVLAAAAMLAVVVWFGKDYVLRSGTPDTLSTVPANEQQGETSWEENLRRYGATLDKYIRAVGEDWGPEKCNENEISTLCAGLDADRLGFALLDLDGNGTQELIIAMDDESQSILDLYTYSEGKPFRVFTGWERNQYYLREGNLIYNQGSGGAAVTYYTFYRYSGTELTEEESIRYDAGMDPENPWFMGADLHPVTEAEAQAAISAHTRDRIKLMDLSAAASGDPAESTPGEDPGQAVPEQYRDTLQKYLRAASDGWDQATCEENAVSTLCAEPETAAKLGYALADLDGNGTEELIIAAEEESQVIVDLYTLSGGIPVRVLSSEESSTYFLREGSGIENIVLESGSCTNYIFSRLNGAELIQEDVLRFDTLRDPENPWFMGFDLQPVSEEEAKAFIDANTQQRVSLTMLSDIR